MNDFAEAVLRLFHQHTGYLLPEMLIPYIVIVAFLTPVLISSYVTTHKLRAAGEHISTQLLSATKSSVDDTSDRLNVVVDRLELTMSKRFDAIQASLELKAEVPDTPSDEEIDNQPAIQPKGFRIKSAQAVRNTIMEKWLEGRNFDKSLGDPNCYVFIGRNELGNHFRIVLSTPYRISIADDGRLPFTLDIWVDGYKKLNFEWDAEGTYSLRGFTNGDWIEDLAVWNLRIEAEIQQAA